jgi:hypothetical protein
VATIFFLAFFLLSIPDECNFPDVWCNAKTMQIAFATVRISQSLGSLFYLGRQNLHLYDVYSVEYLHTRGLPNHRKRAWDGPLHLHRSFRYC